MELDANVNAETVLGKGSSPIFGHWRVQAVPAGTSPTGYVEELRARPGVEHAELDYLVQVEPVNGVPGPSVGATLAVNDPLLGYQWHFSSVQVQEAWDATAGDGVVVAVVDTGIKLGGFDGFCQDVVAPYNAIDETPGLVAVDDGHGHGTHVAGTIAQCTDNGVGVAGVAFDASLMPVKVLDDDGGGSYLTVARGIEWASSSGADVINLSLGGPQPLPGETFLEDAIDAALAQGIVVVAASGNDGAGSVSYPASHPGVIAVGATDLNNGRAWYSNGGSALDLMAPGGDTRPGQDANGDTYLDGVLQETFYSGAWGYYFFQGTSMAAPHVSGAAALLKSIAPALDSVGVREVLEATALDLGPAGWDNEYGNGLIQIADAIEFLTTPDTTPPQWAGGTSLDIQLAGVDSVRLSWEAAIDDRGVASYLVYRDGSQLAQTGAGKRDLVADVVSAARHRFEVRAVDLSGNTSVPLVAEFTAPDTSVPYWTRGAKLEVTEYGESELTLSWSGAADNVGVSGYRIRVAGTTGITTADLAATVSGLAPGRQHLFEVLAHDEAGNWSEALSTTVRTSRAFADTPGHLFYDDILWMSGMDITRGCDPPVNDLFCPDDPVTRAQMAAFLARALGLTVNSHGGFVDVPAGSTFADDIGRLATAGITRGCDPPVNDLFCPDDPITRGQLAAFLRRALAG
ncbi:MAG: S8 family serine peptidase [Acidimicrobiia bacterium]